MKNPKIVLLKQIRRLSLRKKRSGVCDRELYQKEQSVHVTKKLLQDLKKDGLIQQNKDKTWQLVLRTKRRTYGRIASDSIWKKGQWLQAVDTLLPPCQRHKKGSWKWEISHAIDDVPVSLRSYVLNCVYRITGPKNRIYFQFQPKPFTLDAFLDTNLISHYPCFMKDPAPIIPPGFIIAFHGTKTKKAAYSILRNGFDPRRRDAQAWGSGEYFGATWKFARRFGPWIVITAIQPTKWVGLGIMVCSLISKEIPLGLMDARKII